MDEDRYGNDVLAGFSRRAARRPVPEVAAEPGLVLELMSGWVGAIVGADRTGVRLEDRNGRVRLFPLGDGFLLDGAPVRVVLPRQQPAGPARTASGSIAVADARARIARAARILVEGRHDAELVEQIWGDDLRIEGVVVGELGGIDRLRETLDELEPAPGRRIGILVDHFVPGSKESRIAAEVAASPHGAHTRIVGHPFVDVWQAVTPRALGIAAWPTVPRTVEWKRGVCEALGWPSETPAELAAAWRRIRGKARSYADLEPAFLGRVEELIDFVTMED